MSRSDETNQSDPKFDFSAFPPDSCFHERRNTPPTEADGAPEKPGSAPKPRRVKRERRRRIDPTTFEKQYSDEELEFMNAMQRFKVLSGKTFPSYREVLDVAYALGYRRDPDSSASPFLPLPDVDSH